MKPSRATLGDGARASPHSPKPRAVRWRRRCVLAVGKSLRTSSSRPGIPGLRSNAWRASRSASSSRSPRASTCARKASSCVTLGLASRPRFRRPSARSISPVLRSKEAALESSATLSGCRASASSSRRARRLGIAARLVAGESDDGGLRGWIGLEDRVEERAGILVAAQLVEGSYREQLVFGPKANPGRTEATQRAG